LKGGTSAEEQVVRVGNCLSFLMGKKRGREVGKRKTLKGGRGKKRGHHRSEQKHLQINTKTDLGREETPIGDELFRARGVKQPTEEMCHDGGKEKRTGRIQSPLYGTRKYKGW